MGYVLLSLIGVASLFAMSWILVVGARRVLGVKVGAIRALFASVIGWSVAGLIGSKLPPVDTINQQVVLLFIIPVFGGTLLVSVAVVFVLEVIRPSGTGMWLVGSFRSLRGRFARARRYSKIVRIALRHGLGPALRGRLGSGPESPQRRASLARSFREALEEAGVTFVKLGQVLSTRSDLLGPELIAELSKLQDSVAPVPVPEIEQVIVEELGKPTEAFADFDSAPLATASIAQVYGARVVRAPKPMHGKLSTIHHTGNGVFRGLNNDFLATRYHSLTIAPESVPASLDVTATSDDGVIQGLAHKSHPVHGVQFHPESIASENGHALLQNFLQIAKTAVPA